MPSGDVAFDLNGYRFGMVDGSQLRVRDWTVDGLKYDSVPVEHSRRQFGKDQITPPIHRIELRTKAPTEAVAREIVREFAKRWRADHLGPGEIMHLGFRVNGKWSRIPGRPGDLYLPTTNYLATTGRLDIVAEWRASTPTSMDETASSVTVPHSETSSGGMVFPQAPPFQWGHTSTPHVRRAFIAGDSPTPVTIRINGPVTRPWVQIGNMRLELTGTLQWDEQITLDGLAKTVMYTRGRSGSAVSLVNPHFKLADLTLNPGQYDVTYSGVDSTGTSSTTVEWRNASRSL